MKDDVGPEERSWWGFSAALAGAAVGTFTQLLINPGQFVMDSWEIAKDPKTYAAMLRDGYLTSLVNNNASLEATFGLVTRTPFISGYIQSFGVDQQMFALMLSLLKENQDALGRVGNILADMIIVKDPKKKNELTVKLIDEIINIASQDDLQKDKVKELVNHFITKLEYHQIPDASLQAIKMHDYQINQARDTIKTALPTNKDSLAEALDNIIKERDRHIEDNFSMIDKMAFEVQEYKRGIRDLNDTNIVKKLLDNPALLHDINKKIVAPLLEPRIALVAIPEDIEDKPAVAAYREQVLVRDAQEVERAAASQIKIVGAVVEVLSEHRVIAGEVVASIMPIVEQHRTDIIADVRHDKITEVTKKIDAEKNSEDTKKIEELQQEKKLLQTQRLSVEERVDLSRLGPLDQGIASNLAAVDMALHLLKPEIIEAVLAQPEHLTMIAMQAIDLTERVTKEGKDLALKTVISSAVSLISESKVAAALTDHANQELVRAIFDLPGTEKIAQYRNLVVDLGNDAAKFKALFAQLLASKPDEQDQTSLQKCLDLTMDFIAMPKPPTYKMIAQDDKVLEGEVGIYLEDNKIMAKIPGQANDEELDIGNETPEGKAVIKAIGGRDLMSDPVALMELYRLTYPEKKANLDKAFEREIDAWIELCTKKNVIGPLLSMLSTEHHLIKNICELPKIKLLLASEGPANNDKVKDLAADVLCDLDFQENLTTPQKDLLGKYFFSEDYQKLRENKKLAKQATKSDIKDFANRAKRLAMIIKRIDSPILVAAINQNAKALGDGIDHVISKSQGLTKICHLCGIKGENLVKLLPILASEKGLKALSDVVKDGSSKSIVKLLLVDSRIINFAIGSAMTYCTSVITGVKIAPLELLDIAGAAKGLEKVTSTKSASITSSGIAKSNEANGVGRAW